MLTTTAITWGRQRMAEIQNRSSGGALLSNFDLTRGALPIIVVCGLIVSALTFGFWMGGTLQGIERQQALTTQQLTEIKTSLDRSAKDLATEQKLLEIRVRNLETEVEVQNRLSQEGR